jgi:Rps23 Pro-64 3,4-dihydroxylase Tpa1-like proline 4-hydroxylase
LALSQLESIGFCEVAAALDPEGLERLRAEAVRQFENVYYSRSDEGLAYQAYIADFGPEATTYLNSPRMLSLLRSLCGRAYRLENSKSCYTYYLEGCYLAPHRDVIPGERAISVLTYLWAEGDSGSPTSGLRLDIFGPRGNTHGSITASIATREGSLVLGYGTEVWHGRPPLAPSERVIVINGSYSVDA